MQKHLWKAFLFVAVVAIGETQHQSLPPEAPVIKRLPFVHEQEIMNFLLDKKPENQQEEVFFKLIKNIPSANEAANRVIFPNAYVTTDPHTGKSFINHALRNKDIGFLNDVFESAHNAVVLSNMQKQNVAIEMQAEQAKKTWLSFKSWYPKLGAMKMDAEKKKIYKGILQESAKFSKDAATSNRVFSSLEKVGGSFKDFWDSGVEIVDFRESLKEKWKDPEFRKKTYTTAIKAALFTLSSLNTGEELGLWEI